MHGIEYELYGDLKIGVLFAAAYKANSIQRWNPLGGISHVTF